MVYSSQSIATAKQKELVIHKFIQNIQIDRDSGLVDEITIKHIDEKGFRVTFFSTLSTISPETTFYLIGAAVEEDAYIMHLVND